MPSDASFEFRFGQLADAQLTERLPSLLDKRVGFQVIDKDEDETRAVGVAAFILNNLWLYVPIFFIKGDLKGFELLYVKQRDVFVPAIDTWIAALNEHGDTLIGRPVDQDEMGDGQDFFASPEQTTIYDAHAKVGSAVLSKTAAAKLGEEGSLIDHTTWCRMMRSRDRATFNLSDNLPRMSKQANKMFVQTMLKSTDFANALLKFYPPAELSTIAKQAAQKGLVEDSPEPQALTIHTDATAKKSMTLPRKARGILIRDGVYIEDPRDDTTKVFHAQIKTGVLQNPTQPGVYDVLLSDGKYRTCVVLFPVCLSESNTQDRSYFANTERQIALIDIDKPSKYYRVKSSEVFVTPSTRATREQLQGIAGGTKASSRQIRDITKDTNLLFVQNAECSIEARILHRKRTAGGKLLVCVMNTSGHIPWSSSRGGSRAGEETIVEFVSGGSQLRKVPGCLFIPEGTRVFTDAHDTPNFGTSTTVSGLMYKQSNLHRVDLYSSGNTAELSIAGKSTGLVGSSAILIKLAQDLGIHASVARQMLRDTSREEHNKKAYLCKLAAAYDMDMYSQQVTPPFQGGPAARQREPTKETRTGVGGEKLTSPKYSDNTPMLPQQAINQAMEAAESGIQDVFDVTALSALVEKADISELRREFVTDMFKGMDSIGRMLFLFWWHTDKFEDRFGREDAGNLEDTLKNAFQITGDLVLYLKMKTAYSPDAAEAVMDTLSSDIGGAT